METRHDEQKQKRFQIEKLEERIAPDTASGRACASLNFATGLAPEQADVPLIRAQEHAC